MPIFTIEATYRIPIYRQRSYEADTLAEACRLAIEDDDWEGKKEDYETAGETYVTGAWAGDVSPYSVPALAVPSHYGDPELAPEGRALRSPARLAQDLRPRTRG